MKCNTSIKSMLFILGLIFLNSLSYAQVKFSEGNYHVEYEQFSPPVKETIEAWEGKPIKNFQGLDLLNNKHAVSDYKEKKVLLVFWSIHKDSSIELLKALQKIENSNKEIVILAAGYETTDEISNFIENLNIDYTILTNCAFVSEAAFAHHLGNPRLFLIDEEQTTLRLIPEEALNSSAEIQNLIFDLVTNIYRI